MEFILLAFGLVLIVEGLAWMLAPSLLEQILQTLRGLDLQTRRLMGALAFVFGLILFWASQQVAL